ncbi:MAG: cytochrome c assembly protein [Bacteroidetes bacterium]|nr:MAG: cytochrome c assembly protein [Bacteroidota bacterium]
MKRITKFIFSSPMTILLLSLLALVLGLATFIEEAYDTETARQVVYQAKWFELIFFLLILNLFGHIRQYKLLSRKKWAGLVFHVAFIVIIIGAGITRYFGFEGSMHIREGQSSNVIYSAEPYIQVIIDENGRTSEFSRPFNISSLGRNAFRMDYNSEASGKVEVSYKDFIRNAVQAIEENVPSGKNIVKLIVANGDGQQEVLIEEGGRKSVSGLNIGYNNNDAGNMLSLSEENGVVRFISTSDVIVADMSMKAVDTIAADTITTLAGENIYGLNGSVVHLTGFYRNAATKWVNGTGEGEEKGTDVMLMNVTVNGVVHEVAVPGGPGYILNHQNFDFENIAFKIGYGEMPVELPFSIFLKDFILDRYPGSMSPSSYASEVTLIDERNGLKEDHRVFMNNVLDYNKYRFFQSSYDQDEQGTILSVNHDYYGTRVTYLGYILLIAGFILSLFNRHSRFYMLGKKVSEIRNSRKALTMIPVFIIGLSLVSYAQSEVPKPVNAEHAEKFGHLISQTFDGRFEPVHSQAYDVMHKISRKDEFSIEGRGDMNAMQILIDMLLYPEFWKQQNMIYVREKSVRDIVGIDGKYASFNDFFNNGSEYKLQQFVEEAFRKKQSEQNSFDKEIIRVDERLNIFVMATQGSMLKIFPDQNSTNNKWISIDDKNTLQPLTGAIGIINDDLQLSQLNYRNIMIAYLTEVANASSTGDYNNADKILGYLSSIQRQSAGTEMMASESKINTEVLYNKLQIFIVLRNVYAMLSVLLLILAFVDNLKIKKNSIITWALNISIGMLGLAFLYHTFGMILRWYLTGHAPWSNGYESLILVAWGGLLAGFSFIRYSKITLAATALLAFFMLMTASHSSYDPQLTNLQPVLKSYWLIIHVATLTISYGFLGLGFFLGLMNLSINLFKNRGNQKRLDLIISELTSINEMNLTVGIVLATIGTFLGGVWANESWGRYWGWDAKETWALIIVIAYTLVLHIRFIPKMGSTYAFNVASVIGFGSVIMTFVGVNYYLSKGMHSYGAGDTPVFPIWAWVVILSILALILASGYKQKKLSAGQQDDMINP